MNNQTIRQGKKIARSVCYSKAIKGDLFSDWKKHLWWPEHAFHLNLEELSLSDLVSQKKSWKGRYREFVVGYVVQRVAGLDEVICEFGEDCCLSHRVCGCMRQQAVYLWLLI